MSTDPSPTPAAPTELSEPQLTELKRELRRFWDVAFARNETSHGGADNAWRDFARSLWSGHMPVFEELLALRAAGYSREASPKCSVCHGSGRTDNHVTGEVECGACEGSGVEGEPDCPKCESHLTPAVHGDEAIPVLWCARCGWSSADGLAALRGPSSEPPISEVFAMLQTFGRHLKGCPFEALSWAEQAAAELERNLPALRQQLADLEQAKKVSQRCLDLEITI